jgi:D-beta-D-heptose 7-phosphate kinase/D-beta-D-heptose 1-phosphate adenosyltransferase
MDLLYPTAKLTSYIDRFQGAGVLVVGDVMVDEFIWGKVERISPEAPVPVVEVQREVLLLGGAANVVNNIRALGGTVFLAGVVGKDIMGDHLTDELKRINVSTDGIVTLPERPTTIKTRVIAHHQQMVRFDRELRAKIDDETTDKIISYAQSLGAGIRAVVISDYGKGVINERLVSGLVDYAKKKGLIVSVDPKVENFSIYRGVTVITPNHYEAGNGVGNKIVDEESLLATGKLILSKLGCENVVITQGEDGMTLFETTGDVLHIPTVAREVFDVTGAGDTVISTLTLAVAAGAGMRDAALISNYAAGIVVGKVGTAIVTAEELRAEVRRAVGGKNKSTVTEKA